MQALSVLGENVGPSTLSAMLNTSTLNETVLSELEGIKLVRRTAEAKLSLRHPLVQELCLHAIPAEVRRELHDQAARVLQIEGGPMEALSHHLSQAGDSTGALFMLEQLATRAQARGDDRTACQHLRRGLELAREEIYKGELDDPMRAIAIFGRKLGQALNRMGRFSDAEGVLLEVLDGTGSSEVARVDILESLALASKRRRKQTAAERYLRQAIELSKKHGDPGRVARLEMALHTLEHEPTSRTVESLVPSAIGSELPKDD
jgi:serine/threonine-protein kinase